LNSYEITVFNLSNHAASQVYFRFSCCSSAACAALPLLCCAGLQPEWRGEVIPIAWSPRAFHIKKLLTDEECEHIKRIVSGAASLFLSNSLLAAVASLQQALLQQLQVGCQTYHSASHLASSAT
jgi:hypothetical protein